MPDRYFYLKLLHAATSRARKRRRAAMMSLMLWAQAANAAGLNYEFLRFRAGAARAHTAWK